MEQELKDRLIPLEGGINFRDLGGYATQDGRSVKWGHLFRSGTMNRLTPADYEHLAEIGIRTVIDLRTATEQKAEPNDWCRIAGVTYWSRDHEEVFGNINEMIARGIESEEQAHQIMVGGFRHLPFQQSEAYAELFRRLAASEVPLAFNCTAGKDRTGGAAALVLSALGVPDETIAADFNMTERAIDLMKVFHADPDDPNSRDFKQIDMSKMAPMGSAHPDFVTAFLDSIKEKCGSVANYLSDLGITGSDLDSIRHELLE